MQVTSRAPVLSARRCVADTGCQGIECLTACQKVADMYGGWNGPFAAIVNEINVCVASKCSNVCS